MSALQVLAAVRDTGKTLAELLAGLELMPQVLINKRIEKGYDWKGNAAFVAAVAEAEKTLAGRGRVLIRPSGTEPLLRIMVETGIRPRRRRLRRALPMRSESEAS